MSILLNYDSTTKFISSNKDKGLNVIFFNYLSMKLLACYSAFIQLHQTFSKQWNNYYYSLYDLII